MFGAEGPLHDHAQAEARAAVCVRCPLNEPGDWLSFFTVPAANLLRSALEQIKGQGLTTSRDADLHVCSACDCPMKLKVWCRLPHILAHIPAESQARLWGECWIRAEGGTPP